MQTSETFLNNIKTNFIVTCLLFFFREKNASFSSLTVRSFSSRAMLYASKYLWKLTEEESTFFARVDPISVKYLLKLSAIDFISVISFFSAKNFLEMIIGNFFPYSFFNYWPCFLYILCTSYLILNNAVFVNVFLLPQIDFYGFIF